MSTWVLDSATSWADGTLVPGKTKSGLQFHNPSDPSEGNKGWVKYLSWFGTKYRFQLIINKHEKFLIITLGLGTAKVQVKSFALYCFAVGNIHSSPITTPSLYFLNLVSHYWLKFFLLCFGLTFSFVKLWSLLYGEASW